MVQLPGMTKATLAIVTALIFVFVGVIVAIALARGYQIDITKKSLTPTGILVVTSDPDGAQVLIDGVLKTATNTTINLAPGEYDVKIQKEGFSPWEKKVEIKKEEVFKTNAFLFPTLPDLRPLTFTGAINPTVSPDNTKLVYGVASASAKIDGLSGNGVWILDTSRNFSAQFFSGGDFRQIYRDTPGLVLSGAKFVWSPDAKQLLANGYLLNTDQINDNPVLDGTTWDDLTLARYTAQLAKLPLTLKDILSTSAGNLKFSPDETKILYTATASASLPPVLTAYLPGTDPTPQSRNLQPGINYVYDLKEDRNYVVPNGVTWFPSSRHLMLIVNNQIIIMEYDGTNKATVFSGQFDPSSVFVWPNWSKVVILTSLGNPGGQENLYTINLR